MGLALTISTIQAYHLASLCLIFLIYKVNWLKWVTSKVHMVDLESEDVCWHHSSTVYVNPRQMFIF